MLRNQNKNPKRYTLHFGRKVLTDKKSVQYFVGPIFDVAPSFDLSSYLYFLAVRFVLVGKRCWTLTSLCGTSAKDLMAPSKDSPV